VVSSATAEAAQTRAELDHDHDYARPEGANYSLADLSGDLSAEDSRTAVTDAAVFGISCEQNVDGNTAEVVETELAPLDFTDDSVVCSLATDACAILAETTHSQTADEPLLCNTLQFPPKVNRRGRPRLTLKKQRSVSASVQPSSVCHMAASLCTSA